MLTFLSGFITYCHFLLLLVVCFFLYGIQKRIRIWYSFLKKEKQLTPCITPLEETEVDLETAGGLTKEQTEEQIMLEALETLDKSIHYLARQMKNINGSVSFNASSSSQESLSSIYSWTCTSARDTPFSQSKTTPFQTPVSQKRGDQKWPLSLVKFSGNGLQQNQESRSYPKKDFSMSQKQQEEKGKAPTSKTLARLIPASLCPANKSTNVQKKSDRLRFLDYKDQELLNWHIHRKYQPKEYANIHQKYQPKEDAPLPMTSGVIIGREIRALTGVVGPPLGGNLSKGCQQPPVSLRSRSQTPPQVIRQGCHTPPKAHTPPPKAHTPPPKAHTPPPKAHTPPPKAHTPPPKAHTPPRPPIVETPGHLTWPPLPAPEDLMPPSMLICKTESRTSIRSHSENKGAGEAPTEKLTKLLSLLGSSKNPKLKESGTPKEKEKAGGGTFITKEGHCNVGRPNSPKVKQEDVTISTTIDRKMRKLCWADIKADTLGKSNDCEEPSAAFPKYLDSLFMCQNQLELPCIAAAQVELQPQENHPFPKPPHLGSLKPLCLAHTIVESLDMQQAMQDLQVCLAKGLEKGCSQPGVEYPVCLLCGRCTPYCPHPRPQHNPCLLVYPRLGVQDGEVYMTLGFLLKIKRSEANAWGLIEGIEKSNVQWGREQQSRKERSRSRRRRGRGRRKRHRSRGTDEVGECVQEEPDLRMRNREMFLEDIENITAPTSPQPYKRKNRRSRRKRFPLVKDEEEDLCPQRLSAMLNKLMKCLKKAWAKMRGRKKKPHSKRGTVTFLKKKHYRPPSPEEESEEVISLVYPEVSKKGGGLLSNKESALDLTIEKPPKRRTPKDPSETGHFKKEPRRSKSRRRKAGYCPTEPENPRSLKREKSRYIK